MIGPKELHEISKMQGRVMRGPKGIIREQCFHPSQVTQHEFIVRVDLVWRGNTHIRDTNSTDEVHEVLKKRLLASRLLSPKTYKGDG